MSSTSGVSGSGSSANLYQLLMQELQSSSVSSSISTQSSLSTSMAAIDQVIFSGASVSSSASSGSGLDPLQQYLSQTYQS